MSRDRAAKLRLVAPAVVAVLLFAPRLRDVGRVDVESRVSRAVLARSIAPTGDRAVVELGRKPSLLEKVLPRRPVTGRAWVAAFLPPLALLVAGRRRPVIHQPSRPLYILLRRADPRRAPPFLPLP
jgi:hypothetical protein